MRKFLKWVAILLLLLALAAVALWYFLFRPPPPGVPAPPVPTTYGPVRGLERDGIIAYRGIPYASPPLGALRWRPPQAAVKWSTTRDAFAFSRACPQVGGPVPGLPPEPTSEDCLYLNIWAPTGRTAPGRPVIIWIHGGSNTNGSASAAPYNPRQLASRGVVVVSMNYRLGVLGYLAHPELSRESGHGASGNYGLMDIIAALKWVQANIRAFGGDPANVTVMGHSAGSRNIDHLQVSPLAGGLYHRIIAMSGGNFGPSGTVQGNALLADAEAGGTRLASLLGARSIAELRALPAARLISTPVDIWRGSPSAEGTLAIVDGHVVPSDPYRRYAAGSVWPADLLLGYTTLEGVNSVEGPVTAAAFSAHVKSVYGRFADRFLKLYPARNDAEANRSHQRLHGQRIFKWQMASWARAHAATRKGRVWFYRFSHRTGIGPFRRVGAAHGAELGHVFDFPRRAMRYGTQWPWNARRDVALIDTIQAYWVNFVRTGDPNGPGLPPWPGFARQAEAMELAAEPRSGPMPDAAEHRLFDSYIAALRRERLDPPPQAGDYP